MRERGGKENDRERKKKFREEIRIEKIRGREERESLAPWLVFNHCPNKLWLLFTVLINPGLYLITVLIKAIHASFAQATKRKKLTTEQRDYKVL